MMFMAPFTNLKQEIWWPGQEARIYDDGTYCTFWGAATNLMTYSKENHPTKTASATSKKYSSSERLKDHWHIIDHVNDAHVIVFCPPHLWLGMLAMWRISDTMLRPPRTDRTQWPQPTNKLWNPQ